MSKLWWLWVLLAALMAVGVGVARAQTDPEPASSCDVLFSGDDLLLCEIDALLGARIDGLVANNASLEVRHNSLESRVVHFEAMDSAIDRVLLWQPEVEAELAALQEVRCETTPLYDGYVVWEPLYDATLGPVNHLVIHEGPVVRTTCDDKLPTFLAVQDVGSGTSHSGQCNRIEFDAVWWADMQLEGWTDVCLAYHTEITSIHHHSNIYVFHPNFGWQTYNILLHPDYPLPVQ